MTCKTCRCELHVLTVKHELDQCGLCRRNAKARARYKLQSVAGRIGGEAMARLIGRQV